MQKITTYTIVLVMVLIVVAGCKNSSGNNSVITTTDTKESSATTAANQKISSSSTEPTQADKSPVDTHSAKTSLDYTGTYNSTLPVSNAVILFNLTLTEDGYTMIVTSSAENVQNKQSVTLKSTYTWDTSGQIIILNADPNMAQNTSIASMFNSGSFRLFVAENTLYQVDLAGNKIGGDQAEDVAFKKVSE